MPEGWPQRGAKRSEKLVEWWSGGCGMITEPSAVAPLTGVMPFNSNHVCSGNGCLTIASGDWDSSMKDSNTSSGTLNAAALMPAGT